MALAHLAFFAPAGWTLTQSENPMNGVDFHLTSASGERHMLPVPFSTIANGDAVELVLAWIAKTAGSGSAVRTDQATRRIELA